MIVQTKMPLHLRLATMVPEIYAAVAAAASAAAKHTGGMVMNLLQRETTSEVSIRTAVGE